MTTHVTRTSARLSLLALSVVAGCTSDPGSVCTAVFATATITVVDGAGAPVSDAVVTSTLLRTGQAITPSPSGPHTDGSYTILDDSAIPQLRAAGDSIRVLAQHGRASSVTAVYTLDVPAGRHIRRRTRPDSLTLQ